MVSPNAVCVKGSGEFHQEIVGHRLLRRHASGILRSGLEYSISPSRSLHQRCIVRDCGYVAIDIAIVPLYNAAIRCVFVELQYRGNVPAPVAIVGGRPDSHNLGVEHLFMPFHDQLMGACDEREVVDMVEALHNVGPEQKSCPSRRQTPSINIVGIAP